MDAILVVNAGSSSVKFQIFGIEGAAPRRLIKGQLDGIGTRPRLSAAASDKSSLILTPEQEKELDQFQQEKVGIRKQLRAVRAGLDADIQRLGAWVKVLDIVVFPLILVGAVALIVTSRRQRSARVSSNKENNP